MPPGGPTWVNGGPRLHIHSDAHIQSEHNHHQEDDGCFHLGSKVSSSILKPGVCCHSHLSIYHGRYLVFVFSVLHAVYPCHNRTIKADT